MVFESFQYSTAGLVSMGTIGEAAVFGEVEDFLEITCQFFGFHIEGTEAFNTRCIHYPTSTLQRNHLGESSGMLSGVVGIRNLSSSEINTRHKTIDEGRLPYPAITTEEGNLAWEQGFELIDAFTRFCRNYTTFITDGLIECGKHLLVSSLIVGEQVGLIEYEDNGHAISLGRSQETVDEGSRGLRIIDSNDEQSLIDISGNDMTLLGEVDALADNVVATVIDVGNPTFGINSHTVAYGYGIGTPDAFDTEITLDLTIKELAIVGKDGVPATCILYD